MVTKLHKERPPVTTPSVGRASDAVQQMLQLNTVIREPEVLFALERSLRALDENDVKSAAALLQYAYRLNSADLGVGFALGSLKLSLRDRGAIKLLSEVSLQAGCREQQAMLVAAFYTFGLYSEAADSLSKLLSENAVLQHSEFIELANATSSYFSNGWCGLSNSGRLMIGGGLVTGFINEVQVFFDDESMRPQVKFQTGLFGTATIEIRRSLNRIQKIRVIVGGNHLIGSPIDVRKVTKVEGVISCENGGLTGWCWLPGEPDRAPTVRVSSVANPAHNFLLECSAVLQSSSFHSQFFQPRQLLADPKMLEGMTGAISVIGPDGRSLFGSPLNPKGPVETALFSAETVREFFPASVGQKLDKKRHCVRSLPEPIIPIELVMPSANHPMPTLPRRVDIVIPVYSGLAVTQRCLESVIAGRTLDERIIVIVDASPDPSLVGWLEKQAASGLISLKVSKRNRGFPATVNIGLRLSRQGDVVILNNDTTVPFGWLEELQNAVYSASDIGTATPISNDATIFSYPKSDEYNPMPDLAETSQLQKLASAANAGVVVDVPTGHGFCMYVRRECLNDTGLFRDDIFAQGYGEENDFCLRARTFGWRHAAVPGVFVAHQGHQSFGGATTHLIDRNLRILNRIYPGYQRMIQEWLVADPLLESRRRLDIARMSENVPQDRIVLIVTHGRAGGVAQHVAERTKLYESNNRMVMHLTPVQMQSEGKYGKITLGTLNGYANLIFKLPSETAMLKGFLSSLHIEFVEFHHFIGHDPEIFRIICEIGTPYDIFIHDYSWFCPRITLTNNVNGYCGEPAVDSCVHCIADNGSNIEEDISPIDLIYRSTKFLNSGRRVIAPSSDSARRMMQHLPVEIDVKPWETDAVPIRERWPKTYREERRICIVGAIGSEKGYNILLECARLVAARNLPIKFLLVGHSKDDKRLIKTGRVQITGPYKEAEVENLIREQDADFGFLTSVWPETWSYVLSQMWRADLPVLAFDIGAPAERIRSRNGGRVIPLNISTEQLVKLFLQANLFG